MVAQKTEKKMKVRNFNEMDFIIATNDTRGRLPLGYLTEGVVQTPFFIRFIFVGKREKIPSFSLGGNRMVI